MRAIFKYVATSIAVALLCITTAAAETVEKQSAADPRGTVEVANIAGSVQVIGWERAEVQVNADLSRGAELNFERSGERTLVKVTLPAGRSSGSNSLTIHVPRDSQLVINTVSANQTIEDVHGSQRLQAVSGDIRTQVWSGEFEAKTVSGQIVANGKDDKNKSAKDHENIGHARVGTVSGDIELSNLIDEIDLNTVTGNMTVRTPSLSRAQIKTTNGDLHLATTLTRDARVDAEAINGDLTFNLDGAVDAEFDIETFNGDIDNCFGPKSTRKHEHGPGNELRFKEGEGHGHVRVKTLNGDVRICRK